MTTNAFKDIDYQLMAGFFEIHQALGCFQDEEVYQQAILRWADSTPLKAETEVPLTISYQDFTKTYYLDLLINNQFIYELKATKALTDLHHSQLLNYLFIANQSHGKLVNLGTGSVKHAFVNTTLTQQDRQQFELQESGKTHLSPRAKEFRNIFIDLLKHWGTRLDLALYTEAMTHFMGGESTVIKRIPVSADGVKLGSKRVHLLNDGEAFKFTGLADPTFLKPHFTKFLQSTPLTAIHWINLYKNKITFRTLTP